MYEEEKKEAKKWVYWLIAAMIVVGVITTVLSWGALWGRTVVERKVYENSYQYQAGQKDRISILRAQLAELEGQLLMPDLTDAERANIHSQMAAMRIQLSAAQERSK